MYFPIQKDTEMIILYALQKNSVLSSNLFKLALKKHSVDPLVPELKLQDILLPSIKWLQKIFWTLVKTQDITFSTVTKYFNGMIGTVANELKIIYSFFKDLNIVDRNTISEMEISNCNYKVTSVLKARECETIANQVLQLRNKLKMEGDFSSLEEMKNKVGIVYFF